MTRAYHQFTCIWMEAIVGHAPLRSWKAWWEQGNDGKRTLIVTGEAKVEAAPTLKEHAPEPESGILYLQHFPPNLNRGE